MRLLRAGLIVLAATGFAAIAARAQEPETASTVSDNLKASMAALRHYEWIETAVISIKGEEKARKQKRCYYDAEGKLQKVAIDDGAEGGKKRGLRGKAVAKKTEEIGTAMEQAVVLVHGYIPPDPARIQAAKAAGRLSIRPADTNGRAGLDIKDYLKPGDLLTVELDVTANRILKVAVSSYTTAKDKDAVDAVADFETLPDGTTHVATTTFDLKSAGATITVLNSGYKKI
jgi:hypothetical protein